MRKTDMNIKRKIKMMETLSEKLVNRQIRDTRIIWGSLDGSIIGLNIDPETNSAIVLRNVSE